MTPASSSAPPSDPSGNASGLVSRSLLGALAAAACVVVLTLSGWTWRLDVALYDALATRGNQRADSRIVLIEIDNASLDAYGRWPWPRRLHAKLLERLATMKPRGIALNISFSETDVTDPAGDAQLATALARGVPTVLPVMVEPSRSGGPLIEVLPLPALSSAATALGHAEIDVDPDGVARHAYLRAGLGEPRWPTFSLALLEASRAGRTDAQLPGLRNPAATASPQLWVRDHQVMIPYVPPQHDFQRASFLDVMQGRVDPGLLRDRWLLVGVSARGIGDTLLTPVMSTDVRASGLEYQANLLNMLLRDNAIVPMRLGWQLALSIGLALLPAMLAPWLRMRRLWLPTLCAMPIALLVSASLLAYARIWFAPMPAAITLALGLMLWGLLRLRTSQHLAHSDALTQLSNRRLFDTMLSRETQAAQRENMPISLLLIDVDHFKHYNDGYGHQAGDRVLRAISGVIAKHARRPRDVAARYGGDELAVILPETGSIAASRIANRIVASVRGLAIPHRGSDVSDKISVSIGVASFQPGQSESAIDLLERADTALYQAKHAGRDRSWNPVTDV